MIESLLWYDVEFASCCVICDCPVEHQLSFLYLVLFASVALKRRFSCPRLVEDLGAVLDARLVPL